MNRGMPERFGMLLQSHRRVAGLTQEELAEKSGLSVRLLSYLETGKGVPRPTTMRYLAEALALSGADRTAFFTAAQVRPDETHSSDEGQPSTLVSDSTLLTFLIADFRGYTAYTAEHGDEAAALLTSRFADLCERVATSHQGELLELRGDEVLATFSSARQALRAAVELRNRFPDEIGRGTGIEVGIGLDAGDAVPVRGGYRTGALNLAARLQSLARGEVFASETVITLAGRTDRLEFIDRGEVRVQGRSAPLRVFQVTATDEPTSMPSPLPSVARAHLTNLPDERTPFIGRAREIDQLLQLLKGTHTRLVTITGTGGTGKTRLALRVGTALLDAFEDGVFLVSLASVADPALVPVAIADALGITDEGGGNAIETLTRALHEKHLFLILDNYEHLLDASWVVAHLLDACHALHILVTSQFLLHLSREQEYPVSPLVVPDLSDISALERLAHYDSIALFIDRARAAKPDFDLTEHNAATIAEICARLDGLPLAITLAAARLRLFSPEALLQRLSSRLGLLTGGPRDQPARQQTVRAALDWSYDLLSGDEQRLLERLSVFVGGWTFEAAEAICNLEGDLNLLEGLTSLVEKSLVQPRGDDEPRFGMLQTIREYAAEKLTARSEEKSMRGRHAEYYAHIVDEAAQANADRGTFMGPWGRELELEHDNVGAALAWLLGQGQVQDATNLAWGMRTQWIMRGHVREGRHWTYEIVHAGDHEVPSVRAKALALGAIFASWSDDTAQAAAWAEENLSLSREIGDLSAIAPALGLIARAVGRSDPARAESLARESVTLFRRLGHALSTSAALNNLALIVWDRGDLSGARALLEEALQVRQQVGEMSGDAAAILMNLALLALEERDVDPARALLREAVHILERDSITTLLCLSLLAVGALAVAEGNYSIAARFYGAQDVLQTTMGRILVLAAGRPSHLRSIEEAREQLGEEAWQRNRAEGERMSLSEAAAVARTYLEV